MRSTRMTAIAAGVVIMVAGLSACNDNGGKAEGGGSSSSSGGSDTGGGQQEPATDAQSALKAAQQATEAKKSAKLDGTTKTGTGTMTTKGGVDWHDGMQMNLEVTQPGGAGKALKALYTKDAVYMKMGTPMPGGKSWMKTSYESLSQQPGAGAAIKEMIATANPGQPIEWMAAAEGLKVVGKEDVKGVQATHYSGTVSLEIQGKHLSPEAQEAMKKQLEKSKVKSEKLDIWIDSNNLLVKKQEEIGGTQSSTATVYYSGYGTKVDVTPPPASQVMERPGA
ncbi:hypothetical protein AB0D04_38500 [Streptomyces sp. NPDC048483]|uniref:hypothetical protein n=1 Tax=Streptomyces sp. NPDC048483 TaxID=3154927 RepID=UPI003418B142